MAGKMQVGTARENVSPVKSAGKISSAYKAWENTPTNAITNYVQGVTHLLNEQYAFSHSGNTAHRSTPLEAFSFELYENCPVKFLDTVRFPSKEAHTNVKLRVKLRGSAWKCGRTTLTVRKFGSLTVQRSVWTKPRCWTVPCERSDRSNFSAGGKFVQCRVSLASV